MYYLVKFKPRHDSYRMAIYDFVCKIDQNTDQYVLVSAINGNRTDWLEE